MKEKHKVQYFELLGNEKIIDVLEFFLSNDGEFSQIQLMKKTGMAKATAVDCLKKLVGGNVLVMRKIGPTNLYTLNKNSKFVKHYIAIRRLDDEK